MTGIASQAIAARRFVIALLLAGLLPIPVFALLSGALETSGTAQSTYYIVFLLSVAHGGLSGLFWLDRRYRGHMAERPRRYYADPILLAVLSLSCAIILGSAFSGLFFSIYTAWTICHFTRQNWGVLCLTALGTRTARPTRLENIACYIACAGGLIGVLPVLDPDTLSAAGFEFGDVHGFGFALVLAGLGLSLVVVVRQIAAGDPPLRIGMSIAVGLFFLPVYAFGRDAGFVTIGTIHGAQYAIVMSVLAADANQGSRVLRTGAMFGCAAIYLGLFLLLTNASIWGSWQPRTIVLLDTVVIWHFIINAGLWRLRHRFQRDATRESFPFLFPAPLAQE